MKIKASTAIIIIPIIGGILFNSLEITTGINCIIINAPTSERISFNTELNLNLINVNLDNIKSKMSKDVIKGTR
jgi:hypothetical protein